MLEKLLIGVATFAATAASPQEASSAPQIAPAPIQTVPAIGPVAPTPPTDVATIVAKEFPAYDKDRDGALSQAEFGDWMIKLKTIADPASTANEAATKTWVNAAFAQADVDRSKSLTPGELTGFLSQG